MTFGGLVAQEVLFGHRFGDVFDGWFIGEHGGLNLGQSLHAGL